LYLSHKVIGSRFRVQRL